MKITKLDKKSKQTLNQILFGGSIIAVLMAGIGWVGPDIWLASTQWLLVSLVLLAFGIYLKLT